MSHPQQVEFFRSVKSMIPQFFVGKRVVEIGSLNINGSVRSMFSDCDYVGVDLGRGDGVDLISPGQLIELRTKSCDVVVSAECFEHNPFWVETMANMLRISKDTSLVLITCATTGRPEHGTMRTKPSDSPLSSGVYGDYYRNLTYEDFERSINLSGWFSSYCFYINSVSRDLYFIGFRKSVSLEADKFYPVLASKIKKSGGYMSRLFCSR